MRGRDSGGLRRASTTGYYLETLRVSLGQAKTWKCAWFYALRFFGLFFFDLGTVAGLGVDWRLKTMS
jgi:hypothetical protein